MSNESESDWNDDPGLRDQCANSKGFYRPTISSKLKEFAVSSVACEKDYLNVSNSAITSRCKQAKPTFLKEFKLVKDHLIKKKQPVLKYQQSKKFHASKDDSQDFDEMKSNQHSVRFAKIDESIIERQSNAPSKCKSSNFSPDSKNNSKSVPRCVKLGKNSATAQLISVVEKATGDKSDRKNKTNGVSKKEKTFLLRKNESRRNKNKSFKSSKNEAGWAFPIISTDESKNEWSRNFKSDVISSDLEMSSADSENDQLNDLISSLYDISTASNQRGNDPSLDNESLSIKDIDKKINKKHSSPKKVKPSFNKVFISRSQLNSKKRGLKNSEENPKSNLGRKAKAVEEWLSNHCLPVFDTAPPSRNIPVKISSPRLSPQEMRKSPAEEQTKKPPSSIKEDSVAEKSQADEKEIENHQVVEEVINEVAASEAPEIVPVEKVSSEEVIKVAEKSTSTEKPCQVDKLIGDEVEIDAVPKICETKVDKVSQITPVASSSKLDDDWQDKKITFSEVKNKAQPTTSLQKSTQNRDRILKDVSQSVEDFQGKSITFSVLDFNSANKRERASGKSIKMEDTSSILSKGSIKEAKESTLASSFVKKFNEAIEQSYDEKENNQIGTSGLKKKEHLVYDPEMLKCSPSSSQWSYAVDLVNSVLKQNLKSEESQMSSPSCVSNACNRDCLLPQFHSKRITFSVQSGMGPPLPNSNVKDRTNEFSVWKNNNNTHNERKSMTNYLMRQDNKTQKSKENPDKYESKIANPGQPQICPKHVWLGKYKELAIRNNNFRKFNSTSRVENNDVLSPRQGFQRETFISPDSYVEEIKKPNIERDCHTVYPLPVRIVENMHEQYSEGPTNYENQVFHNNSLASNDWANVLPLDTGNNWNQEPPCDYHHNMVPNAMNEEENLEYPANFLNTHLENFQNTFGNAPEDENQTEYRERTPLNRVRFSVMGNTKHRMQVMKHLNCLPSYKNVPGMENPRLCQNYDRLKIEHASVSSSVSSTSSTNSKENKYGSYNMESSIIGTLPCSSNNFVHLPPCNVKQASSSMTLSTLKSEGTPCSECSYKRRTYGCTSQYYSDFQGLPLTQNKSYQDFRYSTGDSSKLRITPPLQMF